MIAVSPQHEVQLDEAFQQILDTPQAHDYVVRRLSQKLVNGQPLIEGELVIAGADTLNEYPLARVYPLHFRKTYYPICFHQDPAREYENHLIACKIIDVPEPIGYTRTTFRSCFLPGIPLDRMSPFGAEPEESNIHIAADMNITAAIGLWYLLENIYDQVCTLHKNGLAHGDLFLHNLIASTTPISPHLIDFEQAIRREAEWTDEQWQEKAGADFTQMFKHAVYLQCTLGRQRGDLADACIKALPDLVRDERPFLRAIARQSVKA